MCNGNVLREYNLTVLTQKKKKKIRTESYIVCVRDTNDPVEKSPLKTHFFCLYFLTRYTVNLNIVFTYHTCGLTLCEPFSVNSGASCRHMIVICLPKGPEI